MQAIGIDIGGTKIAGGVVDELGTIARFERVPTDANDSAAIEAAIVAMIERLADGQRLPVGVAAPGFIDAGQSTVYYTPNIPWRNEPLRERLEGRLGLPVVVDNDANAAGWAEFRFGAGRLVSDMVMITSGTGVGGAVIAGDRLLRGGFGVAGELGHMRVVPDGIPCGCGARGCIEQYGSGRALQRMAGLVADGGGIGAALAAERERAGGVLPGAVIGRLVQEGDPGAVAALAELGSWIGQACSSLAVVLDPQLFVIGGGVADAGDRLLGPVRAAFAGHLPARGFHPEPVFAVAELGNEAGVVGAADLARLHEDDSLRAYAPRG
ncbi:ROK family glucokinase [uncultured Amnibacterium sp.]|uniref:ROK family glucokinase n=1 Tax=uncultured Amnibacterium sp. TaxID=1631851 RepID=UPI0035C9BE2E